MGKKLLIPALISAILCTVSCGFHGNRGDQNDPQNDSIPPFGFWEEDYVKEVSQVEKNDNFTKMMMRLGLSSQNTFELTKLCKDTVFNVRRIRPGKELRAYYSVDTLGRTLEWAIYKHSITHYTIFRCQDSLYINNLYKEIEVERKYADITINTSLWDDMVAAGAPWDLIVEMSDIFAWTVDFFGLHKGDRFQAIYDLGTCDGETVGVQAVDWCSYSRGDYEISAIRYDQGDNGNKYWAPDGSSMRKAFLKAPLKFNRVSSKFSYNRKHPVTGQVRPHTGVDYAAPTGTPVHALGDGTIISAGWTTTGGGNVIKIRHNSVYQTGYLHLSKIEKNIKPGVKVHQGQVIGYVGSTGTSTGPHLDFRVWKNGTPIDPLKLESPSADPIRKENLPALDSLNRYYLEWAASQK